MMSKLLKQLQALCYRHVDFILRLPLYAHLLKLTRASNLHATQTKFNVLT
jgi:hypothetical protein